MAMYGYYSPEMQAEIEKKDKLNQFKNRINSFREVETIEQARDLAKKILPTAQEVNKFNVGDAKCTVLNSDKNFRVTLDSEKEFICYDFVPESEKEIPETNINQATATEQQQ